MEDTYDQGRTWIVLGFFWFILAFIIAVAASGLVRPGDGLVPFVIMVLSTIGCITIIFGIFKMIVGKQERKKKVEQERKRQEEERKKQEEEKKRQEEERKKQEEEEYKRFHSLIQKYGEKFGNAVFNKTFEIGMSLEMVRDILGEDVYLEVGNKFYVGKPFKYKVTFENGKLVSEKKISQIWQNMSKNMLVASWGNPENEKETVYKSVVKLKWFYGGRRTRQNTRVYKWRVDLENNRVVGWKELE